MAPRDESICGVKSMMTEFAAVLTANVLRTAKAMDSSR